MPAKLDRCVQDVMAQGHDEDSAWAICRASLGEGDYPEDATDRDKAIALAALAEGEVQSKGLSRSVASLG